MRSLLEMSIHAHILLPLLVELIEYFLKDHVHFEHKTLESTALERCTQKLLTCIGQCDLKLNEPKK